MEEQIQPLATSTQSRSAWYESNNFKESNWISASTKWFLTFSGKLARIVLIAATLYMSAELYPGVSFPAPLNLAMFIILSFALDMGGLGLGQIAKQARKNGNIEGAHKGERLSKGLITIMIAGLVTVSLENTLHAIQALNAYNNIIDVVFMGVDIILTIARIVCAVSYGHVLNELESSAAEAEQQQGANDALALATSQRVDALTERVNAIAEKVNAQVNAVDLITEKVNANADSVNLLTQQVNTPVNQTVNLSVYDQRLDAIEQQISLSVTEVKQNILTFIQNNYTGVNAQVNGSVDLITKVTEESTEDNTPRLSAPVSTTAIPATGALIPVLDVPGVKPEKVEKILTLFLSGTPWREIPGKWETTRQPVKEAYEAYLQAQVNGSVNR